MPTFPGEIPPDGLNVTVTLTSGLAVIARHSDGQWWVGLPDQDVDVPLDGSFVASWEFTT